MISIMLVLPALFLVCLAVERAVMSARSMFNPALNLSVLKVGIELEIETIISLLARAGLDRRPER
jgi:hypothetical protein